MKFKVLDKESGGEYKYNMYLDQDGQVWEIKSKFGQLIKTPLSKDKIKIVFYDEPFDIMGD